MEGARCVIEGGDGQRRRETGERENLFRIPLAIGHVPRARCEEVTLRPRVPRPILPGDRCAEHSLQEYGPAAGKGHAEEPSVGLHTECTEKDERNPIMSMLDRFTGIYTHLRHISDVSNN